MTDSLVDGVLDLASIQNRSSLDVSLDEGSVDSVHSWQAWSVSRENFLAGRTDLKAREVHLATFPNFPPTMDELKARAFRGEAQYVMLEHYAGMLGERKRRVNEDTRLIEFNAIGQHEQPDKSTHRSNGIHPANSPAQTLNATADSIRAARELLRELTPAQQLDPMI